MDAFEQLVAGLLQAEGHWVRTGFKVALSEEDRAAAGRHANAPRLELDVVALSVRENRIRVVECKSDLDSEGVRRLSFDGTNPKHAKPFPLFNRPQFWKVVRDRSRAQLAAQGACQDDTDVRLCLACGHVRNSDRDWLRTHFAEQGWELREEEWIREGLTRLAQEGYENRTAALVAKLLLRPPT